MAELFTEIRIGKKTYYIAYTVHAMLEINHLLKDESGRTKNLIDVIGNIADLDYYADFCNVVAALARGGELLRRSLGYERAPLLSGQQVCAELFPADLPDVQTACVNTVIAGLTKEAEDDDEEVDLGLAELQQNEPVTAAQVLAAVQAAGFSLEDCQKITPAILHKVMEMKYPQEKEMDD